MLEYLEDVRRLVMSWNLRGRTYGEINRQDKKTRGSVASRLLNHINKLKEDRVKAGADLIIQAARGYVPRKNSVGWVKRFEPCRVILFERPGPLQVPRGPASPGKFPAHEMEPPGDCERSDHAG